MTDHKFTDEEIIKALRCCDENDCYPCRYRIGGIDCRDRMQRDALALINRQKAEIERLNAVHAEMNESLRLASEANKDMQAEIERLESNLKFVRGTVKRLQEYDEERDVRLHARLTANARTEAIKEFAEAVKMEFYREFDEIIPSIMADKIDNLVKEMTEGHDESQNT